MDGVLERRTNPRGVAFPNEKPLDEPRRGVSPFAEGFNKVETPDFKYIRSKSVPLRDLGEMTVVLRSPQAKTQQDHVSRFNVSEKDQAFTIDLSGKIKKGRLLDYLKRGYYDVDVEIDQHLGSKVSTNPNLFVGIWIENTNPLVTSSLHAVPESKLRAEFLRGRENGVVVHFVLPSNRKILKAVKANVSNQQKSP